MEDKQECVGCEYLVGRVCALDGACAYKAGRVTPEDAMRPVRTTVGGTGRVTPEDGLRGRVEHA